MGGREKAPAAASRKIAELTLGRSRELEIWGDGKQLRSFTFIDDCITGTMKLMESNHQLPLNIGSSETVSIQDLYDQILKYENLGNEKVKFKYILDAPQGVRGRSSNNETCRSVLNWEPHTSLELGLKLTYDWVKSQIA